MKLLSNGMTNAKTAKNSRPTYILYLAPYNQNSKGVNICPKATAGCAAACLFSAGRGAFTNVIQARTRKTEYYLSDRFNFIADLTSDILTVAKKHKEEVAIRLNGTSDLPLVKMLNLSIIPANVVFYDYTAIPQKAGFHVLPSGHKYFVTFSRKESNEAEAIQVLKNGGNVAAVFAGEFPEYWQGFPVIDGDSRDDLMVDYFGGYVLGLKAKGKAKKDTSGFVINAKVRELLNW